MEAADFANVKGEVGALSGAPTVQVLCLYQESNGVEKIFRKILFVISGKIW